MALFQQTIIAKRLENIDKPDNEIDSKVYEFCGLTEEEIKIMEGV